MTSITEPAPTSFHRRAGQQAREEELLDDETETLVRADWDRLARVGLANLGAHREPRTGTPIATIATRSRCSARCGAERVGRRPPAMGPGGRTVMPS